MPNVADDVVTADGIERHIRMTEAAVRVHGDEQRWREALKARRRAALLAKVRQYRRAQ
jgi:hypothetical protein